MIHYVLTLEVSVQDIVAVYMPKCETYLDKELHHLLLRETPARVLSLLDEHSKVTPISILHYNIELIMLDEALPVLDNIRVSHLS